MNSIEIFSIWSGLQNLQSICLFFDLEWKGRAGKKPLSGLDVAGTVGSEKDSPTTTGTSQAYLALLPVQVELMLTNGHSPDRLYQCWTGVPRVHSNATMPKSPSGHRCPGEEKRMNWGYTKVSPDCFLWQNLSQISQ